MKKRLILIGGAVVLLGMIYGNWTVSENIEERHLIFSNIDALAETEGATYPTECKYAGYICAGKKDGCWGYYPGLSHVE